MATSAAIQNIGQGLLNRDFGADGLAYWSAEYDKAQADAIAAGSTPEQAAKIADTAVRRNVARSSEAMGVAGVPDWFQHQDHDVALGVRTEDWAGSLQTSNLENYLDHQNYSYGMLQGNTVGQEGSEWWGYQTTQDIQSHLAQGKSFEDAYKLATDQVTEDIMANTGHQNYEKFGTIGYGNPLEINMGVDSDGDVITENRYLNLHSKAIADGNILNPTGTTPATQYQLDDDGNIELDDDGNQIVATDDDGNPITGTPYQWQYVPDSTAPGGYRITAVPFNTGTQTSTAGHDFHMANYQQDGPVLPGGGGANPFTIPTGVQNVDATQFTSGGADKLDLATWAETPAGQLSIAQGDYTAKNKWFQAGADGNLYNTAAAIDHSTTDSNLGLAAGQTQDINWGEGWQTTLSGGPSGSNFVPTPTLQSGMAGAGNTIINLDQSQKSTTAADKAQKIEDRAMASGQGRKGFATNKYQPTGNIRTLGIV